MGACKTRGLMSVLLVFTLLVFVHVGCKPREPERTQNDSAVGGDVAAPSPTPQFEGPYLAAQLTQMAHGRDRIRFFIHVAPAGGQAPIYVSRFGLMAALGSLSLATNDGARVSMSEEVPWLVDPAAPEFDLAFVPPEGLDLAVECPGNWRVGVVGAGAGLRRIPAGSWLRYELDGTVECAGSGVGGSTQEVRLWGTGEILYRHR